MKNSIISVLGSSLEWYDFALFGFFAHIISQNYFPLAENPTIALINTFILFGLGYIVRPLGGVIFGYYGDKYGRTVCLKITPLLITVFTVILAIIPTYHQIGIYAPILLFLTRFFQGLCIGGEYAANMVYLCELSKKNRYLLGSMGCTVALVGVLSASSSATLFYKLFPSEMLISYGWRLAFLLAVIPGLIVFYCRQKLDETKEYQLIKEENFCSKNPIKDVLQFQLDKCLTGIGLITIHAISFYFIYMFLPAFFQQQFKEYDFTFLSHNTILLSFILIGTPLVGKLADRVGGKKILLVSCSLYLLLSIPLYQYALAHPTNVLLAVAPIALLSALNGGVIPGLLAELLPSATRVTTFSIILNVGMGILGGITPAFCFWIYHVTNNPFFPIYLLLGAAVITFFAINYLLLKDRKMDFHYESI